LRRCLVKDRNARLHDIADARLEIAEFLAGGFTDEAETPRLQVWQRPIPVILVAVVLVVASLVTARSFLSPGPEATLLDSTSTHLQLATPPNVELTYHDEHHTVAISPSGRQLAYVGSSEGPVLFLQDLDPASIRRTPLR
jgi:hypothetical protein